MTKIKIVSLTTITMIAFAANSVLCRIALKETEIDAASFTSIRLISGALMLWLITKFLSKPSTNNSDWISAFMLFAYAACFSLAYVNLTVATGALLLFGAIQVTMIGYSIYIGERLAGRRLLGLILALGGLIGMLLPGVSAPSVGSSILMVGSGIAWGIYSLRGQGIINPISVTAKNFMLSIFFAVILSLLLISRVQLDIQGVLYAIVSGGVASGLGYAVWYTILPYLKATNAATVQLSVPVIAAFGGLFILEEPLTIRFLLATIFILGGIALVILSKSEWRSAR